MLFKDLNKDIIKGYMTSDFWMDIGRKQVLLGNKEKFQSATLWKNKYIVHAVDTEGPLYESTEATFERLKA
ncbi:hypothetical protein [Bacteroides hominis]|uniref:hypothetical protein n=1 Tax=Bacteroides hominis TaxID=2763023 RepID=UPI003D6D0E8F